MASSNVVYQIELYDSTSRVYRKVWESHDYGRAILMFDKPYNRRWTRRLIRVETEVALRAKGTKKNG